MSANSPGLSLELLKSREFHSTGIPLLISPVLLRSRNLGQLDLARLSKKDQWRIEIAEVKSSETGMEEFLRGQRKRVIDAGNFLAGIFGHTVKFIRIVGQ